jgi:hypothetical protein
MLLQALYSMRFLVSALRVTLPAIGVPGGGGGVHSLRSGIGLVCASGSSHMKNEPLASFFAMTNHVLHPIERLCSINRTRPSQGAVLVAHDAEDSQ